MVDVRGRKLGVTARGVSHSLADLETLHVVAESQYGSGAAVADLAGSDHLMPDPPGGLARTGGQDGLLDYVAHPGVGDGLAD